MFPKKISQNIDTLVRIHGNVFPWQPAIMGNKASHYKSMFEISLPWLHLSSYNACSRYLKSRRDLLYTNEDGTDDIQILSFNFPHVVGRVLQPETLKKLISELLLFSRFFLNFPRPYILIEWTNSFFLENFWATAMW